VFPEAPKAEERSFLCWAQAGKGWVCGWRSLAAVLRTRLTKESKGSKAR
jgi:hypothetical protein